MINCNKTEQKPQSARRRSQFKEIKSLMISLDIRVLNASTRESYAVLLRMRGNSDFAHISLFGLILFKYRKFDLSLSDVSYDFEK